MADSSTTAAMPPAVGPETLIRIKVLASGKSYKTKLPLADLTAAVLPVKLRSLIGVAENQVCTFERYSDSSKSFVSIDPSNIQAYKTLYRAAKAKLRLNLRATICQTNVGLIEDFNQSLLEFARLNLGSTTTLASTLIPDCASTASVQAPAPAVTTTAVEPALLPAVVPSKPKYPRKVLIETVDDSSEVQKTPEQEVKLEKMDTPDSPVSPSSESTKANSINSSSPHVAKAECTRKYPTFCHYSPSKSVRTSGIAAPMLNATYSWSVYCNNCDKNMLNEHYHCNICDEGDFDLCVECKNQGIHCRGEDHWLIKRFLDARGSVISSTTETVGPRAKEEPTVSTMPGAFTEEKKVEQPEAPMRTCNNCIRAFNESAFVKCLECEDFDLCVPCLRGAKHGHHPGHTFRPVNEATVLGKNLSATCKPGRNVQHQAICDMCEKHITGVRHKCLTCPDWDYCSDCIVKANRAHPGHRFAKIYEPIPFSACVVGPTHQNIHCDGPLCKFKSVYITGIRYKCVICPDIDFCASCEAHPDNKHNKTHPLLKLRTPVNGCNVETVIERDGLSRHARAVEAASAITNAATQIRTIADVKPADTFAKITKDKIAIKDLLSTPVREKISVKDLLVPAPAERTESEPAELSATFVREAVTDGTAFPAGHVFYQTWTIKNNGSLVWPAGCVVRYVGGDNMLNVDDSRPSTDMYVNRASESNTIMRPVHPGDEITFRVILKAPKRIGTAISYWRIKTPDGVPFGHRLWCHINVVEANISPSDTQLGHTDLTRLGYQDAFLRMLLQNQRAGSSPEELIEAAKKRREEQARVFSELRLKKLREELKAKAEQRAAALVAAKEAETVKSATVDSAEEAKVSQAPKNVESSSSKESEPVTHSAPTTSVLVTSPAPAPEAASVTPDEPNTESKDEMFEDAEAVNLSSDEDDCGFVTDEEYDILDASDQEDISK